MVLIRSNTPTFPLGKKSYRLQQLNLIGEPLLRKCISTKDYFYDKVCTIFGALKLYLLPLEDIVDFTSYHTHDWCTINYTPDIRSMWGYIVFAFPFVRSYVHSFVRSFIRSSFRHRVKVFALKFIRPHILKTL